MPKYIVKRPELHYAQVVIEASSPEEAIALVWSGEGDEKGLTYGFTFERDEQEWIVDEAA